MEHGRIIQDGQPVAGTSSESRDTMLRDLLHYAAMYGQDGPVKIEVRSGKSRWRRYQP